MKLLVDLFACQTSSRFRGIGRYTLSLTREMTRLRGSHEMIALANALYQESFEGLRQEFIRLLPPGSFKPYRHPERVQSFEASSAFVQQAYQVLAPDVVLCPNVFEGWGEQGVVPFPEGIISRSKRVAIIYDLIPLIFHEEYLDRNPEYEKWYLQRTGVLDKYDLLLAISEATRRDVINLLKIEPDRVVNISGGVSPIFRKLDLTPEEKEKKLLQLGISCPFVLYIGGNDPRKNKDGALQAFAQLPHDNRKNFQFVVNEVTYETEFRKKAQALGLTEKDIVVTGHISDENLVLLYNLCKVFLFPSLYEGFGLPVLEAMSCGAPVISSNNSSLPEVINRSDALFDASEPHAITTLLQRALTDDEFSQNLSAYGLERAKQFTWEKSAKRAWEAIEVLQEEKKRVERRLFSVSPGQPRMHIAYVSPLPPQKSGIANYSAELLPHLKAYFDIDLFVEPGLKVDDPFLKENFAIFPWEQLLDRRDFYNTVVYHMGNSPFHSHLVDLVEQFPGVVVLHDFFLSHLVTYMSDPNSGWKRSFHSELDYSHGLKGLIEYRAQDTTAACLNWPINWRVIKYAHELISHSEFHNFLFTQFYGNNPWPKPTIIKPLRHVTPEVNDLQRQKVREELGIGKKTFVFCSCGMLIPHKSNHVLIQAFALAYPSLSEDTKIFFVGDYVDEEYKRQILNLIESLNLNDKVKITGYASKKDYEKYLVCADAAIQLCTNTRGETSGAVLDCLAHGLPTIINAHGTLNDFGEEEVVNLSDPIIAEDLAQALIRLHVDNALRVEKGYRAREYIEKFHDPEIIAAAYADVIYQSAQTDERKLFDPLMDMLTMHGANDEEIRSMAKFAAANWGLRNQRRILVDVSQIAKIDSRSGIQRVVKSLILEFMKNPDRSLRFELVRIQANRLLRASRFAETLFGLPSGSLGEESKLRVQPGDTLFMLDSSWEFIDEFIPVFDNIRDLGGKIVSMVYDLIPLRFPEFCDNFLVDVFRHWFKTMLDQSDELLCISRTIAEEAASYIHNQKLKPPRQLDINFFHLGADIQISPQESSPRDLVLDDNDFSPLFLMVGTIEPRKGFAFVLDAFELLWQQGHNYRLCIAGKVGWNIEEVERRIRNHPEQGRRLLFIEKPTDAEINLCYKSATALVAASTAEGFGLPIVEAALHQVPVLASDIPVFREVGGKGAIYFSLKSPKYLAKAIREMAKLTRDERIDLVKKIKYLTWKESAAWVLEILENSPRRDNSYLSSLEARQ
jgi:glycosyltransferase involved in cell wall biosynthesis